MGKKIISFLSDGILSGIFLCVGCCVSMSVESKPLGAFLFSLGLCALCLNSVCLLVKPDIWR